MTAADAARTRAETIWADVVAGIPQPRPVDWPDLDAVSAAGERHLGLCDGCWRCGR